MPKIMPGYKQEQSHVVTPRALDTNVRGVVSEANGGLDSLNMPVESLEHTNFLEARIIDKSTTDLDGGEFNGETQTYSTLKRWNVDNAIPYYDPLVTFDLKSESWTKGWNRLTDINSKFSDFELEVECKEGMLTGHAVISFRHGYELDFVEGLPTIIGEDWWTRWGIFVNDVLVAETGECYARLETLVVPFSVPVGTQKVVVDLRWQSITTYAVEDPDYVGDPSQPLEIFGSTMWVRNTFR